MCVNLWSRHTIHSMETHHFFAYWLLLISPSMPLNAKRTSIFSTVSARISCLFLVAAGTKEVRWGCTKPPQFKKLPLFLKYANEAIPQGLILAHLYVFVLSKCMCVFSPLLFLLCVADSSQDLTESSHCRAACQALPLIYPFSSLQTD